MRAFVTIFSIICLLGIVLPQQADAQLFIDPHGLAVSVEESDSLVQEMVIANDDERDVSISVGFSGVDREDEGRRGPRRDELEARFALLWDQQGWSGPLDGVFEDEEADFDVIGSDEFEDVDFDEYDCIWVADYQPDAFNDAWNDNLEMFEEWVDAGGSLYHCTGTNNWNVTPTHPGGLERISQNEPSFIVVVEPDENYWIELCEWDIDTLITSNSACHAAYEEDDLDDIDNSTWYQVIAVESQSEDPEIIVYDYGRGHCVVSGTTDSFQYNNGNPRNTYGEFGLSNYLYYLESLATPAWVFSVPEEINIDAGEEDVIELVFNPIEYEDGVYELMMDLDLTWADESVETVQLAVVMSVNDPVANLTGTITDASDDTAIRNAWVATEYFAMGRITDGNGMYEFTDLPPMEYMITVSADDFLDSTAAVNIDDEGDFELDFGLLHANFEASTYEIIETLPTDSMKEVEFTVTNVGNGPLSYGVTRRLAGGNEIEPWELRENLVLSEDLEEFRLYGVEFVNDRYYVTGGSTEPPQVYVLNRDGDLIRSFDQVGTARRGMPDITWDGEYFYGSGDANIYKFDSDGDADSVSFAGPWNPNKGIAWDDERELLWICSTTRDIHGYSRDGNHDEEHELDRLGMLITSLTFWADDPDGYQLYITHEVDGAQTLHKMNIENNDTMHVRSWEAEDGDPGGSRITDEYDPYNVVLINLTDLAEGDEIQVWQLAPRKNWFMVEPEGGVIQTGVEEEFTMTFNSAGLPGDVFEGEFIFAHDGVGGESIIEVSLTVEVEEEPNEPPSEFNLLNPADGDSIYPHENAEVTFEWSESIDPNEGEEVTYELWFSVEDMMMAYPSVATSVTADANDILDSLDASLEEEIDLNWWVWALSGPDTVPSAEVFNLKIMPEPEDAVYDESDVPVAFELNSVYPNPFNSTATMKYAIDRQTVVSIAMFDMRGREVYKADLGSVSPGYYTHTLLGEQLPSGLYLIKLVSGSEVRLAKIALMR